LDWRAIDLSNLKKKGRSNGPGTQSSMMDPAEGDAAASAASAAEAVARRRRGATSSLSEDIPAAVHLAGPGGPGSGSGSQSDKDDVIGQIGDLADQGMSVRYVFSSCFPPAEELSPPAGSDGLTHLRYLNPAPCTHLHRASSGISTLAAPRRRREGKRRRR
jgi:hypothetical protein